MSSRWTSLHLHNKFLVHEMTKESIDTSVLSSLHLLQKSGTCWSTESIAKADSSLNTVYCCIWINGTTVSLRCQCRWDASVLIIIWIASADTATLHLPTTFILKVTMTSGNVGHIVFCNHTKQTLSYIFTTIVQRKFGQILMSHSRDSVENKATNNLKLSTMNWLLIVIILFIWQNEVVLVYPSLTKTNMDIHTLYHNRSQKNEDKMRPFILEQICTITAPWDRSSFCQDDRQLDTIAIRNNKQ